MITASGDLVQVDAVQRQGADGYLVKPIDKVTLVEYLKSFGIQPLSAAAEPRDVAIQSIEAMCDLDTIPASVLARLIQRMAGSVGRQLSDPSGQSASSTTKEGR